MDEQDQWLTLYIILFFVAFISGLALFAARSQYRRNNAYEPWHARLAAAEGKPRHDGIVISKASTASVSGVLLSLVALAAIAAGDIFFWSSWSDSQVSATLRDSAQQLTTSGTKAINDSNAAENLLVQDNASVAEQLEALTHHDDAIAAEKLEGSHEHVAGVLAQGSEESLRPQTPLPQPPPTPSIPKRRQDVMRNWF